MGEKPDAERQNAPRPVKRPLTPEQAERGRIVDERTRRMSERGVPQPASGIFGGKKKAKA